MSHRWLFGVWTLKLEIARHRGEVKHECYIKISKCKRYRWKWITSKPRPDLKKLVKRKHNNMIDYDRNERKEANWKFYCFPHLVPVAPLKFSLPTGLRNTMMNCLAVSAMVILWRIPKYKCYIWLDGSIQWDISGNFVNYNSSTISLQALCVPCASWTSSGVWVFMDKACKPWDSSSDRME